MSSPFSSPPPDHLARAINDALGLHQRGDLDGAEKAYKRVLKTWPDQFDALRLYGMLNFQRGRLNEALKLLNQAVRVAPRVADAHSSLGMVLAGLKRNGEALASFDRAVALEPHNVGALINRGRALLEAGRAEEGLASIDAALAREPRQVEGRINRANALNQLGRPDEALREYDQAIMLAPSHPGAHFNRGNVLFAQGRTAEAIDAFQRVLSINPKSETTWNARGVALQALNRNADAIDSFARVLALNGNNADAHFNLSLSLLTTGDYRQGFREYEWRWTRSGMPDRPKFRGRPWNGQPVEGRTILVHAEQGLGDSVMFARYVPLLARAGATVILQVQPELKPLLAGLDGAGQVIARGETEPKCDLYCPLGSLPLLFNTEPGSVPAPLSIAAPGERVEKWRARLGEPKRKRIALAWSGSAQHMNDRNRSVPLATLRPLLDAGVDFVGVQRDVRPDDAALMASEPHLIDNAGPGIQDFADTAAILSLCDLVVSVDTSVAHVAGSSRRPLAVLVPFAPDWRWTLDGARTPWYPDAHLFRQARPGDWADTVARLAGFVATEA